jgi:hypothetical protein
MRVVEADQPFTVSSVQSEGVGDTMGSLRRYRHLRHREPNPMPTFRVHYQNLPVKVEKYVEGRVTRRRHSEELSH